VLERVARPTFLKRVRQRGRRLAAALEALVSRHRSLSAARGLGLLQAIEVAEGAPFDAPALVRAAREHGLLLVRGGERAVRLLPPLNVTDAELDEACARLDRTLDRLEAAPANGGNAS
jgi:acetylornithine/N-succinyldiaminopimelate aminotransferase